jgi:Xaa-Pro aminopeptidase
VAAIKRACEITDRMFERLVDEPFVGRTERDVSWTIEQLFHDEGGETVAFESIVASGPNAARPHARATDRRIGTGETVVVDTGCRVDGYSSDYTRTFTTGTVDGRVREAYAVVLTAQQAGLEALGAGVTGREADAAARRVVDETEFAGTFGHGLGHGLGLEVHEAPRLSAESADTLASGNVVTVEPGIYLEGKAGIRTEDNVVVTEDGIQNLTGFRKDLITVD